MPTTDAYVGVFQVPEVGLLTPHITSLGAITMAVTEEVFEAGPILVSNAIVSLTNVDISEGSISSVVIEWKFNTGSDWNKVASFKVNWISADNFGEFLIPNMPYSDAGIAIDFRAHFLNQDGMMAIDDVSGLFIGIAPIAGAGWATGTTTFNGVPDLAEYAEVENLTMVNGSNTEGGTFASPASIPSNAVARLAWGDMLNKGDVVGWPCGDGVNRNISSAQWKKLKGYAVYMYVAGTHGPENEYPIDNITNPPPGGGSWYLIGNFSSTTVEIDCPRNKKICFWVGAMLGATTTTVQTKLPYNVY